MGFADSGATKASGSSKKQIDPDNIKIPVSPPAVSMQSTGSGLKSISLKNLARKVQAQPVASTASVVEEPVEVPIDMSWNELVTQEGVDEVWRKYSMGYKDTDPRLFSILDNHKPNLVGERKLLIKLKNSFQEADLSKEKSAMLGYLKRSLKNARLELLFEVSPDEHDGPKRAYTVADKFKLMLEKNPDLMKFKQTFGLDLE